MKKRKPKSGKKPATPVMPGTDHGLANSIAIVTAPDFNQNLASAEIIARHGRGAVP
jgi:hypothetical protein